MSLARVLRLVGIAVLASFGALLAYGGYIVVMMGFFDTVPYVEGVGEQTYTCYLDRSLTYPKLTIVFSNEGRRAVIRFPDRDAITTFQRGGLAGDVFRGDGIELVLDPEAYVTGYGDKRIGPCQLN